MRKRTLVVLLPLLASCLAVSAFATEGAEVTYLANEGFLVRIGETSMIFDAFLETPEFGYEALESSTLHKMQRAEPPFASIDVAFTSHEHLDHVQAGPALDFLKASPKTPFLTTPGVLAMLEEAGAGELTPPLLLEGTQPGRGERVTLDRDGLRIEALGIPHDGERFRELDHVVFYVEAGGMRLLHAGDSGPHAELFAPFKLGERAIDIAFVPYWFLLNDKGVALLEEEIRARWIVPMHVPGRDLEGLIKTLAGDAMPDNVVFFENVRGTRIIEAAKGQD